MPVLYKTGIFACLAMASVRNPPRIYAVITGDIVGSTKLSAAKLAELRKALDEVVRAFSRRNEDCAPKPPEFFRGDSWQVLLAEPRMSLRLALLIQATLLAHHDIETRAAIGIGEVERLENRISTSTGEAFTLSGNALDEGARIFRLTGALPGRTGNLALWLPAMLRMCGRLTNSWTRRQAEVMALWLSLPNPTHEAIATSLKPPVAKQSVSDVLASANWHYVYEALKAFNATDWKFLSSVNDEKAEKKGRA